MRPSRAIHLEDIIEALREYRPDAEVNEILAAYAFASKSHGGQTRLSGQPYMSQKCLLLNFAVLALSPASSRADISGSNPLTLSSISLIRLISLSLRLPNILFRIVANMAGII